MAKRLPKSNKQSLKTEVFAGLEMEKEDFGDDLFLLRKVYIVDDLDISITAYKKDDGYKYYFSLTVSYDRTSKMISNKSFIKDHSTIFFSRDIEVGNRREAEDRFSEWLTFLYDSSRLEQTSWLIGKLAKPKG